MGLLEENCVGGDSVRKLTKKEETEIKQSENSNEYLAWQYGVPVEVIDRIKFKVPRNLGLTFKPADEEAV